MSVLVQGNNHDNNSNNKIFAEDEPLTYTQGLAHCTGIKFKHPHWDTASVKW